MLHSILFCETRDDIEHNLTEQVTPDSDTNEPTG